MKKATKARKQSLVEKFKDIEYRRSYCEAHIRRFLAHQIRKARGKMSQVEFGRRLGLKQTVVSRLESPYYGRVTLSTLFAVADKLDCAVLVRFVDYETFIDETGKALETLA